MPNKHSKAAHIPIRTCVVCRQKLAQKELLSFVLLPTGIVYDLAQKLSARKNYVCPNLQCVANLSKWRQKRAKKESFPMNELDPKILNLMQFARKAGKLEAGIEACLRGMHHKQIHLIVITADTSERTLSRVRFEIQEGGSKLQMIQAGSQVELSAALGLPLTGVFGISDKNFAAKIIEYWQA